MVHSLVRDVCSTSGGVGEVDWQSSAVQVLTVPAADKEQDVATRLLII